MLIAAPTRWDEACFAVPAVRAMAASGVRVGVLCAAEQRDFWLTIPGVVVVELAPKVKAKAVATALAGHWQAAVLWEPGLAADACARAKISQRVGPAQKPLTKLLTHPVPLPPQARPLEHRVRAYLAVMESLGLDTGRPEFFAPVELGLPPEARTVLLCPDSDFGRSFEWPLERWEELANCLLADGITVTIASLRGGPRLGHALMTRLPTDVPFLDADGLASLLPLLAVHALVVAADGSLPHLAAHVGATCVTLFGPNDPLWKRPLGKRHVALHHHAACAPCFLPKCPLDNRCQTGLTVPRVLAAVRQKLG